MFQSSKISKNKQVLCAELSLPSRPNTMERPSLEFNLPDTHEEGKLYVVDSLNNLNKLNVCPDESQHSLDEEENTGGTGERMAGSNTRHQCLFFITFILTLIISLALVSLVIFLIHQPQYWGHSTETGITPWLKLKSGYLKQDLRVVIKVPTGNWLGIQTRNEVDQISSRLLSEKKNIEELKKMNSIILKHLNQSGIKEKPSDLHDYFFTHAELKVPGE